MTNQLKDRKQSVLIVDDERLGLQGIRKVGRGFTDTIPA